MTDELGQRLASIATPIVAEEGAELVDVEVKGHPGSRVVRLTVDIDGGVDIERCAAVSRRVGAAFDEADAVAGRYTLQVTSPGIDRPLRGERDFTRNVGRHVRVVRRTGDDRTVEVVGDLVAADSGTVTLDVDGDEVAIRLEDVDHGRVLLPW